MAESYNYDREPTKRLTVRVIGITRLPRRVSLKKHGTIAAMTLLSVIEMIMQTA